MDKITITMDSYHLIERRLKEFYVLAQYILPFTPIDELVDLSADDFRDAINQRIEEGRKL